MTLEELKAEANKLGYDLIKKKQYMNFNLEVSVSLLHWLISKEKHLLQLLMK